VIKVKIKQDN